MGANHPYSQLRAELRRTWLQATLTHYDHGAKPRSKVFDFFPEGGKPDGLENPRGTAENQRTSQLAYGPGRESNRGHLGERQALYAQVNQSFL